MEELEAAIRAGKLNIYASLGWEQVAYSYQTLRGEIEGDIIEGQQDLAYWLLYETIAGALLGDYPDKHEDKLPTATWIEVLRIIEALPWEPMVAINDESVEVFKSEQKWYLMNQNLYLEELSPEGYQWFIEDYEAFLTDQLMNSVEVVVDLYERNNLNLWN